ncbi:MAG: riboflavin synthase [Verrucomicrobia bacterium]|nr:riboflavin synthase [Verrucomicrobiota bacterium]
MFTGIVEGTGVVERVTPTTDSIRLAVRPGRCGHGLRVGDSVAVNGCCLTVLRRAQAARGGRLVFDLLRETWARTNLQFVRPGTSVNLERSLRADGRLGGHFVTGHIDGLGRIARWERVEADWLLEVIAPAAVMRYVVFKGAIAVDGISLTVAVARKDRFRVWVIPHTYATTTLRERVVGDAVNLEADLLGKYVERFTGRGGPSVGRRHPKIDAGPPGAIPH